MELSVNGISHRYGDHLAVDNISFNLYSGQILGLLGPNGAGKSTTMKVITGFLQPSSGKVISDGKPVSTLSEDYKRRIGYLPENNPLYLDMFLMDFLAWAAQVQGVGKDKSRQRIAEVVQQCGLEREKHKRICELSKGYKQRVGLAQAIIHDPELLVLDEPTTGLDPNQITEIRALISQLGVNKTILLSTHILQEVEAMCERVIILNSGKIVADSTTGSLKATMEGEEILHIWLEGAGEGEMLNALQQLSSAAQVRKGEGKNKFILISKAGESSRKAIFELCVSKKWYLLGLWQEETRLEDIFRQLTAQPFAHV